MQYGNIINNVNVSTNGNVNIVQSFVCNGDVVENNMLIGRKTVFDERIESIINDIANDDLRTRCNALVRRIVDRFGAMRTAQFLSYLHDNGFFNAPASTKWHLAYAGGLLAHSINVAEQMIKLAASYGVDSIESCAVIGFFHDVCKMDAYVYDKASGKFKWNKNRLFDVTNDSEHGELSVKRISAFLPLSDAEKAAIEWHMGLYDWRLNPPRNASDMTADEILSNIKAMRQKYEDTCNQYSMVKLAHIADMIASQIVEKD